MIMLADSPVDPSAKAASVGPDAQELIYRIQLSLSSLVLVLVEAALLVRNFLTLSPCTIITASCTKRNHNFLIGITAVTANGASAEYT